MTGTSVATRIAVKLQPPTVYLEYSAADKGDRRVRAVKLAKLATSYNSSYLDKLTNKVIKGFPAGIDCCSINRDQLKGLLAQLLLAVQQNKSDSLRHTSSVHSGRLDQASWQQEDYSSAQASQQSNDLGSVSNGSAAPSAVHIQIDATADLDSRAARRSTDDKDGSNSGCRQPRRESAEPASRQLDNCAAGRLADEQQTWQLSISKQQPGTTQRTQSDLLSALSDDIESELGMLGGSHVASIRQQQLAAAPTSYSSAATVAQAEDFPAANAANKSDNSLVGDDDGDDCLTIEADFLTGDDIDLNKATDYELRLAKAEMDKQFRQHLLQPGQPGYVYDKQADFQLAVEPNEWDGDD